MVKIYENAGLFLKEAKDVLLEREAVCQLILGNAKGFWERPVSPDCMFGMVWDKEEAVLAFCNCAPWNLILHSVKAMEDAEEQKLEQGIRELAAFLKEKEIVLNGLNANGRLCRMFLESYDTARSAVRRLSMDIMECRVLKTIAEQDGIYRFAEASDTDWILESCLAFQREALGEEADRESLLQNITHNHIGERRMRLFCLPDGTPVCMAQKARDLERGFSINDVYTMPAYRGRGYAQTLIHKMCREFFEGGKTFATLFVDKNNPISNRAYEKVGFEIVEDNYDYRFL